MRHAVRIICLLALLSTVAACISSYPDPPPPTQRNYLLTQGMKYEVVWVGALRAVTKSLNVKKADQREGVIVGDLADWSFRENLTVTIKPVPGSQDAYRVDVVCTRSRSVVMRDWAAEMLADVKSMIEKTSNQTGTVRQISEALAAPASR